jgi:16S rRNA (guanine527-N7)-methyltransferase
MRSVATVDWLERAAELGVQLTAHAGEQLEAFAELLLERAVPLGMIARADAGRIRDRHILDSLRAAPFLRESDADEVVDLGSGAGLPGVPLAIAVSEARFTLAESRSRRAAFLELAADRLGLGNVTVHPDRVESLPPRAFDAATARAFAAPASAWSSAARVLRRGGSLVLFAGAREPLPTELPGATEVRVFGREMNAPRSVESESRRSSPRTPLATVGDLVIITAK